MLSLRKGSASLHLAYGLTYTNNLHAFNTALSPEPDFELTVDLAPNLRSRHKTSSEYTDARDLAEGEIRELKLLQLIDERVIDRLMPFLDDAPDEWILRVELQGPHRFLVRPEIDGSSLFLRLLAPVPSR